MNIPLYYISLGMYVSKITQHVLLVFALSWKLITSILLNIIDF